MPEHGSKNLPVHWDFKDKCVLLYFFAAIEDLKNNTTVTLKFKDKNNTVFKTVTATILLDEAEAMEDEIDPSLKVS